MVLEKGQISCDEIEMLLGEYVDRELPECLHQRVSSHIEGCATCQENHTSYLEVIQLASELREKTEKSSQLPSAVSRRLRAALNQRLGISLPTEK